MKLPYGRLLSSDRLRIVYISRVSHYYDLTWSVWSETEAVADTTLSIIQKSSGKSPSNSFLISHTFLQQEGEPSHTLIFRCIWQHSVLLLSKGQHVYSVRELSRDSVDSSKRRSHP